MDISQNSSNCMYNLILTKFNENIGRDNFFSYDLQYPYFFNIKNDYFYITQSILDNINSTIKLDIDTFTNELRKEEQDYNSIAPKNNLPKKRYKAITTFSVTFNKNHILSVIVNLIGMIEGEEPLYNYLYNYNYDLLTGNEIPIKNVFNSNINYIEVITNYVNYKVNQNPSMYYQDVEIVVPADQAFYLTEDGVVIYFGIDEIAPSQFGIAKFKMQFSKFSPYINPRFYCSTAGKGARLI
ncbi:MAG: DUF3298 and DUF4163 domain-containing protein [Romboutsia sp.]